LNTVKQQRGQRGKARILSGGIAVIPRPISEEGWSLPPPGSVAESTRREALPRGVGSGPALGDLEEVIIGDVIAVIAKIPGSRTLRVGKVKLAPAVGWCLLKLKVLAPAEVDLSGCLGALGREVLKIGAGNLQCPEGPSGYVVERLEGGGGIQVIDVFARGNNRDRYAYFRDHLLLVVTDRKERAGIAIVRPARIAAGIIGHAVSAIGPVRAV
jgi:hypothetical protein